MENQISNWCAQCGTQLVQGSAFCASCGAKVVVAPAPAPAPTPTAAPTFGAVPQFAAPQSAAPKIAKRKPLLIAIGAVVAVAIAIFAVTFISQNQHSNPITAANADSFLVAPEDVSTGANLDSSDPDFTGFLLTECPEDEQATTLFTSGDTLASVAISSEKGADQSFSIAQRIYTADAKVLSDTADILTTASSDAACDASSDGTFLSYRFTYAASETIKDAYGYDLSGVRIKETSEICSSGFVDCVTSSMYFVVAIHDTTAMLIKYTASVPSVESAVDAKLKAFAN